jgi:nicotinamide-nucleotide amidase
VTLSAAVLCIGSELTRGEILNTNGTWLAEQLTSLGAQVTALECTDDHPARIETVLARLCGAHDLLLCTGGLGPTTDDVTAESVAALLRAPLQRDPASLSTISERLRSHGRVLSGTTARQADLPRGAGVLPNTEGFAPGFVVTIGKATAYFLPGVPAEAKAMFARSVTPALRPLLDERDSQIVLKAFGLPEAEINDRLDGLAAAHGVTLGYRVIFPEVEVKVNAPAAQGEGRVRCRRAAADIVARLGREVVYGEGDQTLADAVGTLLQQHGQTVAVADGATGGLLAHLLTASPAGGSWFAGGVLRGCERRLAPRARGAPPRGSACPGADQTEAMAQEVRRLFGTSLGLALTTAGDAAAAASSAPMVAAVATGEGGCQRVSPLTGNREQRRTRAAFAALAALRTFLIRVPCSRTRIG